MSVFCYTCAKEEMGIVGQLTWFEAARGIRRGRMAFATAGCVTLGVIWATTCFAATPIAQSFLTTDRLPIGALVSLQANSTDQVAAATNTNVDNLIGAVITADSAAISLSSGVGTQAQVATSGTLPILVSDINGSIVKGDHITASQIAGVGMKANSNVRVIGIAQGDMTGATKQDYTDKSGVKHSVTVGQVPVLINVSYFFKEPDKTVVPAAIQNVANSIAGRSVNTLPIIISAAIFLVMLIVVSSIIYSMIHSSIISVGRNPMSQSAIYRDLIQLSSLVLGILAVGIIAIYLVLTRL